MLWMWSQSQATTSMRIGGGGSLDPSKSLDSTGEHGCRPGMIGRRVQEEVLCKRMSTGSSEHLVEHVSQCCSGRSLNQRLS